MALIQQEPATVWRGGKRRYLTRKGAVRGAAKAFVRADLRGQGLGIEDCGYPEYLSAVAQVAKQIDQGSDAPTLDWDLTSGEQG